MNSNSNTASFGQQPQQGATHATDNRKREHNDGVGGCSAVASSPSQSSGQSSIQPEQFRKVFIGGLNYRTSEVSLRDYFSKYGVIVDCVVMQDQNGRSRGFGFVTYSKSTMVDDLMKNRPHLIDGREVDVKRAMPKESATPEIRLTVKKIFIGAIKEGITEKDLKDYFGQYGSITDCVVMRDCNGMHRGFGFVEFDDIDAVDRIVLQKNHTIKGQSLDVKKAVPKKTTALQAHQQKMSGGFTPGNFNNNRFSRDDFVNRNGGLSSARGRSHPYNSRSFGGGMDAGGRSSTAFYNRRSANNYAADDSAFSGGEIGNNNSHHPYYQHENRCRGDSLGRNDYRVPSNSYARRSEFGNNDVGMYNTDSKNDLRSSNFSNRGGNGGYNSGNLLNNQHYQHDLPPSSSIGPIRPNRRDFDHHGGNNIFDDTNNVASNEGRRGTTYRQDRSAARVHDIYKRNDVASGYNAVDQSPGRFTSSSYSYQQRNDNNMSSSRYTRDIINSDYPANSSNRNSFASSWNNNPAHQQPLQLERSMDRRDDSGVTNFFDNDIIDHSHRDYDRANSRMRIHQQDCRSANYMNANNRDYNSYGGNIPASDYNQDNSSSSKINNIRRRGGGLRNSPSSYGHPSNSSFGAGGNVPSGTSGRFNSRGRGRNFNGPSSNQAAAGGGGGGRFNYSSSNNNFNNDVYDNRPPLGNSANTLRNVGNGSGSYWSS